MSRKITDANVLAAVAAGFDDVHALATYFMVNHTNATLRRLLADLADHGRLFATDKPERPGVKRFSLPGIAAVLLADEALRDLFSVLLEADDDGASSNDVGQIVDDWFTERGFPTILYR